MTWKIKFYKNSRGDSPVNEFIDKQDSQTHAKIIHLIELLEIKGPYLNPPYMKKLQKNLYELRSTGKIAIRIFYSKSENVFYILHIFKKTSQKTPRKELKLALDRIKELV